MDGKVKSSERERTHGCVHYIISEHTWCSSLEHTLPSFFQDKHPTTICRNEKNIPKAKALQVVVDEKISI
jgi:hypothetical protein